MSTLAVYTDRGRQYSDEADAAMEAYCALQRLAPGDSIWDGFSYAKTIEPCPFDFVVIKHGRIAAIVEVKARNMTSAQLFKEYGGEWLLSLRKYADLRTASEMLRVPAYGLLYLLGDGTLLRQRLCGPDQDSCRMRVETSPTQATCNGGTKSIANCYICMQSAKTISIPWVK